MWRSWRLHLKKPNPTKLYMYDDVNPSLIPKNAQAVAGYIGGRWPTYPEIVKGWPKAKHLSIAVASYYDADCLDIEPGDATIATAPAWLRRQHATWNSRKHDVPLPVLYTSAAYFQKLVDAMRSHGFVYGKDYLCWIAHYTGVEHYCGPQCGFGIKQTAHATQYTDKALGRSLDKSVCSPKFFA